MNWYRLLVSRPEALCLRVGLYLLILVRAFRSELTAANPELISGDNSSEPLLAKIQAEREALKPVKKTRKKKARDQGPCGPDSHEGAQCVSYGLSDPSFLLISMDSILPVLPSELSLYKKIDPTLPSLFKAREELR